MSWLWFEDPLPHLSWMSCFHFAFISNEMFLIVLPIYYFYFYWWINVIHGFMEWLLKFELSLDFLGLDGFKYPPSPTCINLAWWLHSQKLFTVGFGWKWTNLLESEPLLISSFIHPHNKCWDWQCLFIFSINFWWGVSLLLEIISPLSI